jgi:hypothetical protein
MRHLMQSWIERSVHLDFSGVQYTDGGRRCHPSAAEGDLKQGRFIWPCCDAGGTIRCGSTAVLSREQIHCVSGEATLARLFTLRSSAWVDSRGRETVIVVPTPTVDSTKMEPPL